MFIIAAALLLLLLIPHDAFAWGPGFHLQIGTTVLGNLQSLSPAVATLLGKYPLDFLYGCIAADITIGKKFTHYLQHCHRWPMGLKVLSNATVKSQEACALGYLCHLAADTVAHNYFVPYKIMLSFSTLTMKHTYWEMRFDSAVDKKIWEVGERVATGHYKRNDVLLRKVLSETLFSFATNKRIFNSILLLGRMEKWQGVISTVSSLSRYVLEENDRQEYTALSEEAVFDFLNNRENSRYFLADPTGGRALATAEAVRKNLRILYKSGKIAQADAFNQLEELKPKLRRSICAPALLQQIHPTNRERKSYRFSSFRP
ncbi:MAG: zinc dependent phospholipase C family protein [Geobacteraceae bacterium]|nr:zinc dependent phospholipase C family protein [Geobacteraceae bacterium]